jgi:hypothetical protein
MRPWLALFSVVPQRLRGVAFQANTGDLGVTGTATAHHLWFEDGRRDLVDGAGSTRPWMLRAIGPRYLAVKDAVAPAPAVVWMQ